MDHDGQPPSRVQRAAVLGSPIGHSKSPQLHAAAYRYLGLDIRYEAIDVTAAELPALMQQIRADPEWVGLSVTMPLKAAMAELVDELSPEAAALGVVNTVTFDGAATAPLRGHNTDIAGVVNAVHAAASQDAERVVILGAGGTALAAAAAAAALHARSLDVLVRTPAKAAEVQEVARQLGLVCRALPWDRAAAAVAVADVVISTLPPRAADPLAASLADLLELEFRGKVLLDVAYDPWPSELAGLWQRRGGLIVPGLDMLLYQGVEQVRLFTGPSFSDPSGVIKAISDALGAPRSTGVAPDMAG